MGGISTGLATITAIQHASASISGSLTHPNPSITTAPSSYQSANDALYYSTFPNDAKAVIAYGPALSLLSKQYTASKSIFGFCRSYEYMNSGLQYTNANANCASFQAYLPTNTTFDSTLSSFVDNTFNAPVPPQPINDLTNRIVGFANQVAKDPSAVGQAQNSYSASEVKVSEYHFNTIVEYFKINVLHLNQDVEPIEF